MRVDAALLLACGLPAASAMSTNPKDISWLPPSGRVSGVSTIIPHHPLMSAGHQVATSVTPLDTHYTPWAPHVAVTGGVRPGMGSALESLMLNSLLSSSSTTSTTTSSTTQKCMTMMAPMMMGGMGTGSPIEKMMMMQTLMGSTTSSTTPKLGDCMKDPKVLMLMVNTGVDGSRAPSSLGGLGGGTLPTSDMQHTLMMMQLAGLGQSSSSSTSNPNPVATLLMAKALGGHSWQSQPYTAATPVQYAVAAPQPKEVVVHIVSTPPELAHASLAAPSATMTSTVSSTATQHVIPPTGGTPVSYIIPSVPPSSSAQVAFVDSQCPKGGLRNLLGLRTSYGVCI